jgi:hypothetical protein
VTSGEEDNSSRSGFRLAVIAVVILAIVLLLAIVYGSIHVVIGPLLAGLHDYSPH